MRNQSGEEMFFQVKKGAAMKKIMQAFADHKGVSLEVLRFTVDGARVNAEDTPRMLEMEDGDQIDVILQQLGGGDNTNSSDEDVVNVKDVSSDNLQHVYVSAQEDDVPDAQHVPAEISLAINDQQVRVVVNCLFIVCFYCLFMV